MYYLLGLYRCLSENRPNDAITSVRAAGATATQYVTPIDIYTPGVLGFVADGKLWLAINGTAEPEQWIGNIFGSLGTAVLLGGNVHHFFASVFSDAFSRGWDALTSLGGVPNVVVYGHSLGGAMALLIGEAWQRANPTWNITILTSGSPRVFGTGWTPTVAAYHRYHTFFDPVARIPLTSMTLWNPTSNGIQSTPIIFRHYGIAWGINANGQIANVDVPAALNTLQTLLEAGNPGYWHATTTYQDYFTKTDAPGAIIAQISSNALDVLPTQPENGWPVKTVNGAQSPPDPRPIVPPAAINNQLFGGTPVVPASGPFNLTVVTQDPPSLTLSQLAAPPIGGAFVPGPSNLWEVSLNYQFRKRTFSEKWYVVSPTTDAQTILAGFTPLNCGGLLAFRPGGCVLWSVRTTMHLNPQYGATKFCNYVSTRSTANDPALVNNAILVVQRGTGGRTTQRMIRCWEDATIEERNDGTLVNQAAVQAFLDGYKAAQLNCLPNSGHRFRERRTKNPNNFYPVGTLTQLPSQQTQIDLTPADYAALTGTGFTGELMLFGRKDRNIFGIRGIYYAISYSSPSVIVQYEIPNFSIPYNPSNLFIRRLIYNVDTLASFTIEDVRTRKTSDPSDRVRGRGLKVATRFSRG